jgi:hypothetical protein
MTNGDQASDAITAISVRGFKSLYEEGRIEIRPLTILAGANNSGKSSVMQPLLLLKQTLEAPYDAGPLKLDGPNVAFTDSAQFFSHGRDGSTSDVLLIGVELANGTAIRDSFARVEGVGVDLVEMTVRDSWRREVDLRPRMSDTEIAAILPEGWRSTQADWRIERYRCWLACPSFFGERRAGIDAFFEQTSAVQQQITRMYQVSAARALSGRTYPLTRPGALQPGRFEEYIGGLAWQWQATGDPTLSAVGDTLATLGLTRSLAARQLSEAQVELLVDRLPVGTTRKKADRVNVADVGPAVAEVLPVLVALQAAAPGQLVYLEEPEMNLHPRAQTALAAVLADAARRGVRVVAETHSSLLLLGVQTLVAEGKLEPNLVKLHWFSRDKRGATKIATASSMRSNVISKRLSLRYETAVPARNPKRIVVDASVAWACNDPDVAGVDPNTCAAFLRELRAMQHRAVMSPDLEQEWTSPPPAMRQPSSFGARWLAGMLARGLVDYRRNVANIEFRYRLEQATAEAAVRRILRDDVHLIEAAMATDRLVASLDEQVRWHLRRACRTATELSGIIWVNPDRPEETPIAWLRTGARAERRRMLGYATEEG